MAPLFMVVFVYNYNSQKKDSKQRSNSFDKMDIRNIVQQTDKKNQFIQISPRLISFLKQINKQNSCIITSESQTSKITSAQTNLA